jgi:hypothetical protein
MNLETPSYGNRKILAGRAKGDGVASRDVRHHEQQRRRRIFRQLELLPNAFEERFDIEVHR